MAAFGTEKTPTTALNLGMPAAFSYNYANRHFPERYAPTAYVGTDSLPEGSDFQAHWHEQKRADARHMAAQKVKSTVMSGVRAFSSAHGVYGMPKPVLGQRKFANPSFGAQTDWSTRWDNPSAGAPWAMVENTARGGSDGTMVGGVVRTAAGQAYAKTLLNNRIGQLNNLEANARRFQLQVAGMDEDQINKIVPFAGAEPTEGQQLGQTSQVELAGVLQSIVDSLIKGGGVPGAEEADFGVVANKLTFTESARAFSLIVRVATTGTSAEIRNILEYILGSSADDGIIQLIKSLGEGRYAQETTRAKRKLLNSLEEYWERVQKYLISMLPTVGRPYKDRLAASKTYIASLGFTRLFSSNGTPQEFLVPENAQQALDNAAPDFPGGGPGGGAGAGYSVMRREDSQQGGRGTRAEFSASAQNPYQAQSGSLQTGAREVEEDWGGEPRDEDLAPNISSFEEGATQGADVARGALGSMSRFQDPTTGAWNLSAALPPPPPDARERSTRSASRASTRAVPPASAPRAARVSRFGAPLSPEEISLNQRSMATVAQVPQRLSQLPTTQAGFVSLMNRLNRLIQEGVWTPQDGLGEFNVPLRSTREDLRKEFARRLNLWGTD